MTRAKISEYSATANDNTDVNGINIAEGCPPSSMNNMGREIMAALKRFQVGSDGDGVTVGGNLIVSGTVTAANTATLGNVTSAAFAAGSAGSPTIHAAGDTNTGIFFPAADTIAFSEGGAEAMRIDSGGNLGLGVTPSAWSGGYLGFQVKDAAFASFTSGYTWVGNNWYSNSGNKYIANGTATLYEQNSGVHSWFNAPSGTAGNAITFAERMRIDSSGNVGIGTSSPIANSGYGNLTLSGSSGGTLFFAKAGSQKGYMLGADDLLILASTDASGVIRFYTGGNNERARITSGGEFLVGTTAGGMNANPGIKFLPAGEGANLPILGVVTSGTTSATSPLQVYSTGAGAFRFYVGANGTVNATNTTISAISDQRFKENIRDLDDGLSSIMALQPRKFDWKEGKGADIKDARGFIAQEFETVFPDLIDEWKDPAPEGEEPYKSVRQDLIPVLVKSIQELKAELDTVKAELATLKG